MWSGLGGMDRGLGEGDVNPSQLSSRGLPAAFGRIPCEGGVDFAEEIGVVAEVSILWPRPEQKAGNGAYRTVLNIARFAWCSASGGGSDACRQA